jgi:hypothetical protein
LGLENALAISSPNPADPPVMRTTLSLKALPVPTTLTAPLK